MSSIVSFHIDGPNLAEITQAAIIRLNTFIADAPVKDYSITSAQFEPETTIVSAAGCSNVTTWRGHYTIRLIMDGET